MSKDTQLADGDVRKMLPRFTPEAMEKNHALVALLKRIADSKAATPAQIALAWLLGKEAVGRAHSRHDEAVPPGRKPRVCAGLPDGVRCRGDRDRRC